jgi:hypothetical protein
VIPHRLPDLGGNPSSGDPSTLEDAQANVSFTITLPGDLSDPAVYLVNGDLEKQLHVVSLVYQTDCGPISVTEQVAPMSDDEFLAFIQRFAGGYERHPGFPGFAEQRTIHDAVPAIATEAPGNTVAGLTWQEASVRYQVLGPSVSDEQLVTVAESGFIGSLPTGVPPSTP